MKGTGKMMHDPETGLQESGREFVDSLLAGDLTPREKLQGICDHLMAEMENCDWAGFYLVDAGAPGQLVLGPFAGAPTEHTRIGFGEGICGQAASTEKTFVIADVSVETNYLSCSPDVRSEIVVPVLHNGSIIGEIDLDSHTENGFGHPEREYLEWLAGRIGELVETVRNLED